MGRDRLIAARAGFAERPLADAEDEIEEFLLEGIAELNQQQRVVLLAENFEYEVLVTAEWLTERYKADIRCYRCSLSLDEGCRVQRSREIEFTTSHRSIESYQRAVACHKFVVARAR